MGTFGPKIFENDAALDLMGALYEDMCGWPALVEIVRDARVSGEPSTLYNVSLLPVVGEIVSWTRGHGLYVQARAWAEVHAHTIPRGLAARVTRKLEQLLENRALFTPTGKTRARSRLLNRGRDDEYVRAHYGDISRLVRRLKKPPRAGGGRPPRARLH